MTERRVDESDTFLRQSFEPEPLPRGSFTLQVIEGADVGKVFQLNAATPTRVLIGQSPACEIRLGDREVSRRHAAVESAGYRLRLTDLNSTNGTFVDGIGI